MLACFLMIFSAFLPQEEPIPIQLLKACQNGGGVVHLGGAIMPGITLKNQKFTAESPLIIEGEGAVLYAFEGPFKPYSVSSPPKRMWGGLTIDSCSHVIVRDLEVWGGVENAIELLDSKPEYGLHHIRLENLTVRYAETRGVFMGGSNISDIYINVDVFETIYSGNATHGIYLSGGIWNADYPPLGPIHLDGCTVGFTGGRHGIQINGRVQDVRITDCTLFHNQLCGLSLIGVRNVSVEGLRCWGNGRSAIVVYDYFDTSYWDPNDPKSVKDWYKKHHSNGDITIRNSTLMVGPTQWIKDKWHNNDPSQHPCILINNEVNGMETAAGQIYFPPGPITAEKNILISPNPNMVEIRHKAESMRTLVRKNLVYAYGQDPYLSTPVFPEGKVSFSNLFKDYGLYNYFGDPRISTPGYPLIDLTKMVGYDWGSRIEGSLAVDLLSPTGKRWNIGYPGLSPIKKKTDEVPLLVPVDGETKILKEHEYPRFIREARRLHKDKDRGN